VATLQVPAAQPEDLARLRPLRAIVGAYPLTGVFLPAQARPQTELPVVLAGYGRDVEQLQISMEQAEATLLLSPVAGERPLVFDNESLVPAAWSVELRIQLPPGRYPVVAAYPGAQSVCHWLARPRNTCMLGQVEISGVSLPEGAVNFEDKIALLAVDLPETTLIPGGRLPVNLTWQALAPIQDNFTVFVQVLDAQDRIVGQVDAWPRHGTYPTAQWRPGEIIDDPYQVQLLAELPPGQYRLLVGWYLLATLRRLPVVDDEGIALDDKVTIPALMRP
jgi:hypothetical protein